MVIRIHFVLAVYFFFLVGVFVFLEISSLRFGGVMRGAVLLLMIISIPSVFPLSQCCVARCCGDGVHISHFVCESTSHFPPFSVSRVRVAFVSQIDFPSAIQREQSNRKKNMLIYRSRNINCFLLCIKAVCWWH